MSEQQARSINSYALIHSLTDSQTYLEAELLLKEAQNYAIFLEGYSKSKISIYLEKNVSGCFERVEDTFDRVRNFLQATDKELGLWSKYEDKYNNLGKQIDNLRQNIPENNNNPFNNPRFICESFFYVLKQFMDILTTIYEDPILKGTHDVLSSMLELFGLNGNEIPKNTVKIVVKGVKSFINQLLDILKSKCRN